MKYYYTTLKTLTNQSIDIYQNHFLARNIEF